MLHLFNIVTLSQEHFSAARYCVALFRLLLKGSQTLQPKTGAVAMLSHRHWLPSGLKCSWPYSSAPAGIQEGIGASSMTGKVTGESVATMERGCLWQSKGVRKRPSEGAHMCESLETLSVPWVCERVQRVLWRRGQGARSSAERLCEEVLRDTV